MEVVSFLVVFFSSRRRHTISYGDWSSDVCSSDLGATAGHQRSGAAKVPAGVGGAEVVVARRSHGVCLLLRRVGGSAQPLAASSGRPATISRAISREAVAAGEGALQT